MFGLAFAAFAALLIYALLDRAAALDHAAGGRLDTVKQPCFTSTNDAHDETPEV